VVAKSSEWVNQLNSGKSDLKKIVKPCVDILSSFTESNNSREVFMNGASDILGTDLQGFITVLLRFTATF
jgi:hypothetical protein